jgi:hypothetical protein
MRDECITHNCSDCGRRMCDPLTPSWVDCGCREGDECRNCQECGKSECFSGVVE